MERNALIEKFGIPLAMLHSAKDTPVKLEMCNGDQWNGTVVNVDESGNVELCNATRTDAASKQEHQVKSAVVRFGAVLYVTMHDTDKMTAQWPMLKLVQRGAPGVAGRQD